MCATRYVLTKTSRMRGVALMIGALACTLHCARGDIGAACPDLDAVNGAQQQDGRSITDEIVEQRATFPCDELICIATRGSAGYCTKKCRSDDACPQGFECRAVQSVGDFAQD